MNNPYIEFYSKYNISPVSQDIQNLELHINRRKRLYQLLGICPQVFKGAHILEVGAGSGYNTLVFLLLGARVDIVEPNSKGREVARGLFEKYSVRKDSYHIYKTTLERYEQDKKYDFVIAEGFLPFIGKIAQQEVVANLKKYVNKGGYIITTATCEMSYFFEDLRRILGNILIAKIDSFEEQTKLLVDAFEKHLKTLRGVSRPIVDWVRDVILNPSNDVVDMLDIPKCVRSFCARSGGGGGIY